MIPSHYIKENARCFVPRRWVFLDSEAYDDGGWDKRTQSFRLAVTAFDRRRVRDDVWAPTVWTTHTSPTDLWEYIAGCTRKNARTVVVGHNLGYDLRICQAFTILPAMGWKMTRLYMGKSSISASFSKGSYTLAFSDSMSWLPMSLQKIGGLVGTQKVDLPDFKGSHAEWERRCRVDVEILRSAMMDIIGWIRDDDLGNWKPSGAGMSWAIWRHKFYTHKVLVHADEGVRDAETEACYTGRCEAWQHGRLSDRSWTEWDLSMAYPRIARDTLLPVRLGPSWHPRSWRTCRDRMRSVRVLVRATVTTPVPCLPLRDRDRFLWPVGTFTGWWWDVELLCAEEYGATIIPEVGITYAGQPALRAWSDWVTGYVEHGDEHSTPVRQAVAKNMSRALIGKFGSRFMSWEPYGESPEDGVDEHPIYDADAGKLGKLLTLGDKCWVGYDKSYAADASPAIMGAIMAECRVRLWQLMNVAGLDHIAYVDTDSLIVDDIGASTLTALLAGGGGWNLRVKHRPTTLTILGPRQTFVDGDAHVAGVAKSARRTGESSFVGDSWEQVETSLQRGRPDTVTITPRQWNITGKDDRRGHNPDGTTFALEVNQCSTEQASSA